MVSKHKKSFFNTLWAISAVASAGMLIWASPKFAGSFSMGCVGMILNFYVLFSLLEGVFHGKTAKQVSYIMLLMTKFVVLGLAIFLIVRVIKVDLLAFGLGFFLVAISATYATGKLQNH